MAPAMQPWQHTAFSIVSFVALLTNFLVAFAPLPQAITVHQVHSPPPTTACRDTVAAAQEHGQLEGVRLPPHMRQLPLRHALRPRDQEHEPGRQQPLQLAHHPCLHPPPHLAPRFVAARARLAAPAARRFATRCICARVPLGTRRLHCCDRYSLCPPLTPPSPWPHPPPFFLQAL